MFKSALGKASCYVRGQPLGLDMFHGKGPLSRAGFGLGMLAQIMRLEPRYQKAYMYMH